MLNASVNEFRDLLLTRFLVIGVVRYTSVSDLCHCVTPKVVGFFKSVPLVVCVPEGMNVPVPRLTCVPNGMNVCVNTNTVTLFSQAVWYKLIQFNIP